MSTKTLWHGQPIEALPREELELACVYLAKKLAEVRSPDNIRALALGKVEMLKARVYGPSA